MTINHIVRIAAGFFVLLSLGLGVSGSPIFVNANFLWFTAFVGANLFQSGFTNICPLVGILKKFGFKESCESC
ncbi:MAG: YgaP family membrane protein [Sulfuricella sp.]